jgi:ABC-type glycerol-3-phosphate transport system permease component
MKIQITNFSSHQTAKVFSVVMAAMSLFLFVPMSVLMAFAMPAVDQHGNPVRFPYMLFLLMPVFYLLIGYVMTRAMCGLYNWLAKYIGGVEFEGAVGAPNNSLKPDGPDGPPA